MKKRLFYYLYYLWLVHSQPARKKFALIDMEYILKNIPAYEQANTQLNQASQQYQARNRS